MRIGLSPRVRGNLLHNLSALPEHGSIPARAGEPSLIAALASVSGVYPRACGGTGTFSWTCTNANGLSPRVRGNLQPRGGHPHTDRSIPARAGEPGSITITAAFDWVYPRACGGTADV